MSLNVSGLSAYTDENKMSLIKKFILGGRTLEYITVQPDIKSSATINIIDSTLDVQAGACGWSAAGTTALTQRTLSVCPLKINESICLNTLESYYTQKMMNPGSYNEEIPFEQIFAEEKAGNVAAFIEDLIWQGDVSGGSGDLALCDGYLDILATDAFSSVVNGNPTGITVATGIVAGNVVGIVDGMVDLIPTDIIDRDDLILFMGYDTYRLWARALRNANLFHYTGAEDQGEKFSQMIPGTNVRAVATRGLNGTDKMVLSSKANMYFGTDLLNDAEDFSIFYSKDNDEVRFLAKWKQGVNVAFLQFCVYFRLVP